MIGIIPVIAVLYFGYLVYEYVTYKAPEKASLFGRNELFVMLFFIGVVVVFLVNVGTFIVFDVAIKNQTKEVYKGGWDIKTFKTVQETHKSSKGRTYTTNNIHILADMNDGTYRVISLPTDACVIKQGNSFPRAERFDLVRNNKYFTLITGFDVIRTDVKYVITIPKGSIIEEFLAM